MAAARRDLDRASSLPCMVVIVSSRLPWVDELDAVADREPVLHLDLGQT
jgi:hypothetical protein